jgi:hypothetical protein
MKVSRYACLFAFAAVALPAQDVIVCGGSAANVAATWNAT